MHKSIKRFGMEGTVGDDSDFLRVRTEFEKLIIDDMRGRGYVPLLEFGPFWSTELDPDGQHYNFVLSVYGIHVGGKKAWKIEGLSSEGRLLPRHTPPTKSPPPSGHVEL